MQSSSVVVFGQSGGVSEIVPMASGKILLWKMSLPADCGFFRAAAGVDLSSDNVSFCERARRQQKPAVGGVVDVPEHEDNVDDVYPTASLEARMAIALRSVADPVQATVTATADFFETSTMSSARMINALSRLQSLSTAESAGWNAQAKVAAILGVDRLYWAKPTNKKTVALSEDIKSDFFRMVKEGQASNHTYSNYQIREQLVMGKDLDWDRQALVTVGRVTRLIQSALKKEDLSENTAIACPVAVKRKYVADKSAQGVVLVGGVAQVRKRAKPSASAASASAAGAEPPAFRIGAKRCLTTDSGSSAGAVAKILKVKHGWETILVPEVEAPTVLTLIGKRAHKPKQPVSV